MKKWKYFVMFFAALALLAVTAYAQEMESEPDDAAPVEEVSGEETPEAALLEEEAEETGSAELDEIPAAVEVEYEGTADLFQCGSLTGEYTRPGEVSLFAEDEDYRRIKTGMTNRQGEITLTFTASGDYKSRVKKYFESVVNDNPRLYYVGNTYNMSWTVYSNGALGPIILKPTYSTFAFENATFEEKVKEMVDLAKQFPTPLERMLYVHDYLALNCAYNWDIGVGGASSTSRVNAHNAYGVLVEGDAVCQGYALAFKLIMDELGYSSVCTTSESMNHMWNIVQLDGEWYHVDVTWDDPVADILGQVTHSYFLLSDETIRDSTHKHKGWSASVTCSDKKYESEYIFNDPSYPVDRIDNPIYFWNGNYYYVRGSYQKGLYSSKSLSRAENESPIATFRTVNGVSTSMVWVNDMLFYVNENYEITQCNLTSGVSRSLGTVSFTPYTITNGKGETFYNGIGLRYDSVSDRIIARASTQRMDLGSFEIPKYPPEWDEADSTQILGLTDDRKTAGVWCNAPGMTLCVAYYREGRMVSAQTYLITGQNLQLVKLGTAPTGCELRMFLLTGNHAPACKEYSQAV